MKSLKPPRRNRSRNRLKLLLLVILIPVLNVSTGCTSTEAVVADEPADYREVLKGMIPELPEVPAFPQLSWSFEGGKYCISESDADRLLDFGENTLPMFRWEIEACIKQLDIVLKRL